MSIYLHKSLVKAAQLPSSADQGVGEQRGGSYVARVQTGFGKDNKPRYRYFKTAEEYKAFQESKKQTKTPKHNRKRGSKAEGVKRLEEVSDKERSESSMKTQGSSLFVRRKGKKGGGKKKKGGKMRKSNTGAGLFLEVLEDE